MEQFQPERKEIEDGLMHLWKIQPSIEGNRVTITIPREIRHLGIYSGESKPMIIMVHGNRFEIREIEDFAKTSQWLDHVASCVEKIRSRTRENWEDLNIKVPTDEI